MMWSIANLKENINQMAFDVHQDAPDDDDDDLEIYHHRSTTPIKDSPLSADRRSSNRFSQTKSPLRSSISNGTDSGYDSEIEKYKSEIQRLQTSEAEIKALSVNYAALLKEKEERIFRLHEENGSLKKNLEATINSLHASKNDTPKTFTSKRNVRKGSGDQSPYRQHILTTQVNNNTTGNHIQKGVISKQDVLSNGSLDPTQLDDNFQGNDNELAGLLEEKNKLLAATEAKYDADIKQLKLELNKEHESLAALQLKLNVEQTLNGSLQKELFALKTGNDKNNTGFRELQNELSEKVSEIKRLQFELTRRDNDEEENKISESLRGAITSLEQENLKKTSELKGLKNELNDKISEIRQLQLELTRRDKGKEENEVIEAEKAIANLEKENTKLKREKAELEGALKLNREITTDNRSADVPDASNSHSSNLSEVHASKTFPEKEELELSVQKLNKELKEACQERDKALQELSRLKQHLLDKELEESDKMDEDSKIIEELRASCDYQRSQILHLEKALKQAITGQEDIKKSNISELHKSKEMINDLNQKLSSCITTIDAKNVELMNLQTALGQYYAESEAKERLERDLALAREELAKFPELLRDADLRAEVSEREKDEILTKLSQVERLLSEGQQRVSKLEEDNSKLRRALEQSMTRLNRMSVDSDYFVDRRIVIKLLVTYFQRNHSKEVLDLMVRMLGFTEEDKQRIGMAQQGAGKGVVRGVLGFPGRLVGGILGGSSGEAAAPVPTDNQSFADLWVDFLLKETEERERRELMATTSSKGNTDGNTSSTTGTVPDYRTSSPVSTSTRGNSFLDYQSSNASPFSRGNMQQQQQPENSDTEFSTVPLTTPIHSSSEYGSRMSKYLPRY